ncbi:hypothetical protein JOB18_029800 [Solea senegalensis]|nr:caspase-8 [Solea senegalensis]KAG7467608.1 caspase-8-like isoform X2 [Solea senegalensis]KAG7467609.1 hypothetical protein JOB18_029800 [Solea senegalensis]
MDFQRLLLEVGKAMCKDEVKALKFLCTDFLGRNPNSIESANDLFSRLVEQDCLSPEQPQLLIELLLIIQRPRLVRDLNLNYRESTTSGLISPYRKLLYNLYEEMTDDDLKHVKFLLNPTLPRRKLEDHITMLEIFLEMEHMDLINDTNLIELENIFKSVCPVLKEKIYQFKAQHTFQSQAQSPINSFNFSVDALPVREQRVTPPHTLSGSNAETSKSVQMCSDASAWLLSQENKTSPEKQTSQKTNTNSEVLAVYPMTAAQRGICLIINNYNFSQCYGKNREGTLTDEKCLQEVFGWLGFAIEIWNDCTSEEMLSVLRELSSRDHSQMDCMVCCILSHGQEGTVQGVEGKGVKLKDLTQSLNAVKCPSLAGKPKLFFIQACQGADKQKAVQVEADGPACSRLDAVKGKNSIPCDADFLQAMATIPFFVSYRDKKNGSWFIQSLCQHLVQMVPKGVDLMSILTQVNADVSQKTDDTGAKKQMPQPAFSLRKRVVFPIPEVPPPSLPSFSQSDP